MVYEYNLFFYANACHVCKHFGKGVHLKRCGNCTMISYCSKEHQRQHWPQHKDLCTAICNVLEDNKASNFLTEEGIYSQERWTQIKMNFMLLVGMKIERKLEHYEEQMFKFLRACAVCHKRDSKALEDCLDCPSASFCMKHKNDATHRDVCPLLRLCFNLDITSTKHERKLPETEVPHRTKQISLPNNMKNFIQLYVKSQKILHLTLEEETAISAEYLTRPLTLLYAIQKLDYVLKDDIIIHIIAANMIEIDGIELWEVLLHWLPDVTSIKIVLIGPELFQGSIPIDLCKNCLLKCKQLSIDTHGTLYETYANSGSFLKPHFIIGYNAGIHECEDFGSQNDTWAPSLRSVAKQNCPFILTSYTLPEADKEQARLKVILDKDVKCTFSTQNPYSSLRPYRDFETEGIYYQNQYIIVYKQFNAL